MLNIISKYQLIYIKHFILLFSIKDIYKYKIGTLLKVSIISP